MATVVATLAVLVAAMAACGEDGGGGGLPEGAPPPPTATPSGPPEPELTGPERAAVEEVLDVLDRYLEVFAELATEGIDFVDLSWMAELAQYGAPGGEELSDRALERNHLSGHLARGTIDWELVEVIEVDLERQLRGENVPGLRLRVCIDESDWVTVNDATGDTVDAPAGRYLATLSASYSEDEFSSLRPEPAWRIAEWELARSRPC